MSCNLVDLVQLPFISETKARRQSLATGSLSPHTSGTVFTLKTDRNVQTIQKYMPKLTMHLYVVFVIYLHKSVLVKKIR